jgi:hypothetical protein
LNVCLFLGGILSLNQPKQGIYQCIGRNSYGIAQANTVLTLPNNTKPEGKKTNLRISLFYIHFFNRKIRSRNSVQKVFNSYWSK